MTLRQHTSADNHTNDATFRAVCQTFHDSFVAAGLVQTADTGQINLATVTRPVATNTVAGYEIWQFNDALATAAPLYFKFEYATGSTTSFNFWVTTGTGSNGTGTITTQFGTPTTRRTINTYVGGYVPSALTLPSYFDYLADGSGFALMYWPAAVLPNVATASTPVLVIERFRNHDGTPNADGWNVFYAHSGNASNDARLYSDLVVQPTTALNYWPSPNLPSFLTTGTGSTVLDWTLYPAPVFTGSWPRAGGPSQLVLAVGRYDVPVGATMQVSHYGEIHAWIGAGTSGASGWGSTDPRGILQSFIMRAD